MDHLESNTWVENCVDLLAPPAGWEPDLRLARQRLQSRAGAGLPRRFPLQRYLVAAVAIALLCILAPAIPQALAQQVSTAGLRVEQVWYWLTLVRSHRGAMRSVALADVMRELHATQTNAAGNPQPASSIADAAALAGFTPRLPDPGVLPGAPRLSVWSPAWLAASQVAVRVGPAIQAAWPNVGEQWTELTLMQGAPPVVAAQIDVTAFTLAALQSAGMRNRDSARALATLPLTLPALLTGYRSPSQFTSARDISLRNGRAVLVEEFDVEGEPRVNRITLMWSAEDRAYLLTGMPSSTPGLLSLRLAGALASAIDVANSLH
jgi:hypothetical protein